MVQSPVLSFVVVSYPRNVVDNVVVHSIAVCTIAHVTAMKEAVNPVILLWNKVPYNFTDIYSFF